jgi:hypothetical protein
MTSWDITGSWTGEYSYHPNELHMVLPPSVGFTLTARAGWFSRFRGTVQDDPKKGSPEEATIRGKIVGTRVTFVKQYPICYMTTGDRLVSVREWAEAAHGLDLDRDVPPAPIRYRGEYDPVEQTVLGTWKQEQYCLRIPIGRRVLRMQMASQTGDWSMRRQFG